MLQVMIYQNLLQDLFGTLVALTEITLKVLPKKKNYPTPLQFILMIKKIVNDLFEKNIQFK